MKFSYVIDAAFYAGIESFDYSVKTVKSYMFLIPISIFTMKVNKANLDFCLFIEL